MYKLFCLSTFWLFSLVAFSQVGIGTTDVDNSAILELKANNRGFLMPRMTTDQRNSIISPTEGLIVFNTDRSAIQVYREDIGESGTANAWYDLSCEYDIQQALSTLSNGIVLDFSTQEEYGQFYPDINGGGTAFTSSTPDGTNYRSIGPIPQDITNLSGPSVYINHVTTGDESPNPFVFQNESGVNEYNASTFLSRNRSINSAFPGTADRMISNAMTPYYGDIDIVLVARKNTTGVGPNLSAFFSTGPLNSGIQIGLGNVVDGGPCTWSYYSVSFAERRYICGGTTNRVAFDQNFHRFRVKYEASIRRVSFYIDGNLIEAANLSAAEVFDSGSFRQIIQNLKLFKGTDDSDNRQFAGSVSFLAIYTNHLTDSDFNNLDKYLECKFENHI